MLPLIMSIKRGDRKADFMLRVLLLCCSFFWNSYYLPDKPKSTVLSQSKKVNQTLGFMAF